MNLQEHQLQSNTEEEDKSTDVGQPSVLSENPDPSMSEFFQLQRELIVVTSILTAVIFLSVWVFYSLNASLNYLIGSCVGIFYLRLLARHVEQLGRERRKLGQTRLAAFVILILIASRLEQLEILPIFLGFLTYKASLIVYVLRTALSPTSNS